MINLNNSGLTKVDNVVSPRHIDSSSDLGLVSGELAFYNNLLLYWDSNVDKWKSVQEYWLTFSSSQMSSVNMKFDGNDTDLIFGTDVVQKSILTSIKLNRSNTIPASEISFTIFRNNVYITSVDFESSDINTTKIIPNDVEIDHEGSLRVLQVSGVIQSKVSINIGYRAIL